MARTSSPPPTARSSYGPEVDTALHLWVVLSRAHAAVAAQALENIRQHGLTGGEFGVLELLYHKGPQLLGEIQRRVLVSSGGITFLVDKLADKGLVERTDCPTDRRARYAVLTKDGEKLIAKIFPAHARRITQVVKGLDRSEQEAAIDLLRRLGLAARDASDD